MKLLLIFLISIYSQVGTAEPADILIGAFSKNAIKQWDKKVFNNNTQYSLVTDNEQTVLKAHAKNSASGLFFKKRINLKTHPFINWRWKTTSRLTTLDETTKENDDYSARIYVITSGGIFFWQTQALNYVWSNSQNKESHWDNAYAPNNAHMLAIRDKNDTLNVWHNEKRNVLNDLKKVLGKDVEFIDAIAIMSDTDNTHGETTSYFGDIYFSAN